MRVPLLQVLDAEVVLASHGGVAVDLLAALLPLVGNEHCSVAVGERGLEVGRVALDAEVEGG